MLGSVLEVESLSLLFGCSGGLKVQGLGMKV